MEMYIRFADGTEKPLSTATEHKVYNAQGEPCGWTLAASIKDMCAADVDSLITAENIKALTILTVDNGDSGEVRTDKHVISGYTRVTAARVRYVNGESIAEIQLMKGLS